MTGDAGGGAVAGPRPPGGTAAGPKPAGPAIRIGALIGISSVPAPPTSMPGTTSTTSGRCGPNAGTGTVRGTPTGRSLSCVDDGGGQSHVKSSQQGAGSGAAGGSAGRSPAAGLRGVRRSGSRSRSAATRSGLPDAAPSILRERSDCGGRAGRAGRDPAGAVAATSALSLSEVCPGSAWALPPPSSRPETTRQAAAALRAREPTSSPPSDDVPPPARNVVRFSHNRLVMFAVRRQPERREGGATTAGTTGR